MVDAASIPGGLSCRDSSTHSQRARTTGNIERRPDLSDGCSTAVNASYAGCRPRSSLLGPQFRRQCIRNSSKRLCPTLNRSCLLQSTSKCSSVRLRTVLLQLVPIHRTFQPDTRELRDLHGLVLSSLRISSHRPMPERLLNSSLSKLFKHAYHNSIAMF